MKLFKKKGNKFFFYNEQKQVFVSKDKPLFVYKELHAKNILNLIRPEKKKINIP